MNTETRTYSEVTSGIKVSVLPKLIPDRTDPDRALFSFSYTITIENLSEHTVQLLERHWIINSGGEQLGEVVGPGVVGEQPVLNPGESFKYTSGVEIHDPIGYMVGSYTFKSGVGEFLEVGVPKFDLIYPMVLH